MLGLHAILLCVLGFVAPGVVLYFGIQFFLSGLFGWTRCLNENVAKQECNFLKLFYKTENTTLVISLDMFIIRGNGFMWVL